MSDHSAIQWTDATWNPTTGCTKVSPGCANCYIERTPAFRIHGRKFVGGATDLQLHESRLEQPLRWKKPRRVFVNSLSDLFHPDVPDAFIDRVFAVMALCPQHTFQVLTKRADRMRDYMAGLSRSFLRLQMACPDGWSLQWRDPVLTGARDIPLVAWPIPNVWLGVSVENQHFADERIPLLLQTPAVVRFISAEPLIGAVDLRLGFRSDRSNMMSPKVHELLHWVIVGGESGPKSRPFDLAWARSIVQQCEASGVACFVKQLGEQPVCTNAVLGGIIGRTAYPLDKLRDKKGGDPSEWPEDLRVREFPNSVGA